jgi:hypothetical protein
MDQLQKCPRAGYPSRVVSSSEPVLALAWNSPSIHSTMDGDARGQRSRPKLLDRVRQETRLRHYSPRTEQAYLAWIRRFILANGKRHPRELGEPEVTAFVSGLATLG